jgi:branched-chain amino acid transport system permease protein
MTLPILVQLIFSGLAIGSIYGLVALSYNAIYSTDSVINFSQGELVVVGSLIGASLYGVHKLPLLVALAIAIPVVAGLALLVEYTSVRAVRNVTKNLIWIMSTFGFGIALKNLTPFLWGKQPLSFPNFIGSDSPWVVGGVRIVPQELGIVVITLLCTAAFELYRRKTIFGVAVRATQQDRETAGLMGINARRVVRFSYAVSGALCAISGFLVGPVLFADPSYGVVLTVKGFIALILGGLGSGVGGVLGGLVLGLVESLSSSVVPSLWKDVVTFGLLILVMVMRPQGFFGGVR